MSILDIYIREKESSLKTMRWGIAEAKQKFSDVVDRNVLALFMRHNYVPAPYSIFRGVFKLPGGTFLVLHADGLGSMLEPQQYWSACNVAQAGVASPLRLSEGGTIQISGTRAFSGLHRIQLRRLGALADALHIYAKGICLCA